MSHDVITVEVDDTVAVITLNRPDDLNASNAALHGRLATIWDEVAALDGIRAVVLTGAGPAFSAGGDFGLLDQMVQDPQLRSDVMDEAAVIARAVVDFPLPLIAAVNGPAVGLGASLAGFADLVVMDEKSFLADPHVSLGLVAGDGSVLSWPLHIGLQRAKEWILLGGRISAQEALRIGLANRVAPAGQALKEALELARRVAALPPQSVRGTLDALDRPLRDRMASDLDPILDSEKQSFDEPEFQANLARLSAASK
ncbi:enoyl-CoA hydratase/isomerase family protein [Aeromicrobium choanae]|uniref:Enoyl-CoA hydratase n=1 Tax=Aeromicrobium choanae TaxID=1736691 RepID=A0A1T4YWG3_9ACTN|nr:enoyl-CoA hydratase/isomerase family protein [Aeromicrobium choanae]SKB06134.1 enoyl-CoA hydratase [Aeromicrobium choanae]